MDKVFGKTVRKRIQCLNFLIRVKIPQFFRNKIFYNILVFFIAERAKRRKTWSGSPSKVPDPVLDANDLEVDRTMGSMEYLAPHHRRQENMYIQGHWRQENMYQQNYCRPEILYVYTWAILQILKTIKFSTNEMQQKSCNL